MSRAQSFGLDMVDIRLMRGALVDILDSRKRAIYPDNPEESSDEVDEVVANSIFEDDVMSTVDVKKSLPASDARPSAPPPQHRLSFPRRHHSFHREIEPWSIILLRQQRVDAVQRMVNIIARYRL
jgi:hypothetical protein